LEAKANKRDYLYSQSGDYLLPDVALPEAEQATIGKYGMLRHTYLKTHRRGLYAKLLLSGITSFTATNMIQLVIQEDELTVDQIARVRSNRCNSSAEEFLDAMTGIVSPLQRELFGEVLRAIEEQTRQIERIEAMVQAYTTEAYDLAAKAIEAIPGIGRISAEQIIAEIGVDISRFPTPHHLCSWAGLSPGDNESPGKRKSGKTD